MAQAANGSAFLTDSPPMAEDATPTNSPEFSMSEGPSPSVQEIMRVYDAIPHLKRIREEVLLADVWQQAELGQRERSMITCALLAALGRDDELASHVDKAIGNGVTHDELRGMAVHLCFYAGWPAGLALGKAALPHFEEQI